MDEQRSGSRELQCVGRLEIARPKPVGFLCGSIPVPTDKAFHDFNSVAALVPSSHTYVYGITCIYLSFDYLNSFDYCICYSFRVVSALKKFRKMLCIRYSNVQAS